MGAKTFNNQTGHPLIVQLTVRAGGDVPPGNEASFQKFSLAISQSLPYPYSDETLPYLDSILATPSDGANLLPGHRTAINRGDPADNDLNTNNTVTFTVQGQAIVLGFSIS